MYYLNSRYYNPEFGRFINADAIIGANQDIPSFNLYAYDGYEGNFTAWLVPFCEPACKIRLQDEQYAYKNGVYYVLAVETKFSSSGGSRTITIGKKIG